MKVVNLCVSLLVLSFVVACQPKTTTSDQIADEVYQVDSLLVLQDSLIGDTVEVEGFCVDICGHGGSHITLMGSDTTQIVNVEAGPQIGSFSNDLRNNNVRVKVVINEQRVDEAFLSDWEHRLDESLKTPQIIIVSIISLLQNMPSNNFSAKIRKWLRIIHRDLSFIFAGIIIVYAVSGIALNHKRDFNSDYRISRSEIMLKGDFPKQEKVSKEETLGLLEQVDEENAYMKHYYFGDQQMKVFLKLSAFNRLHYNPMRWWTWFSDVFAVSLIIITITGLFMNKGNKGIIGRGGIEFIIGILIPVLFLIYLS